MKSVLRGHLEEGVSLGVVEVVSGHPGQVLMERNQPLRFQPVSGRKDHATDPPSGARLGTTCAVCPHTLSAAVRPRSKSAASLGSVWIQREFMTAAAILIMAAKL
jgi:hypothetical protein